MIENQREAERQTCLQMKRDGLTPTQIAERTGLTRYQVYRRINSAEKAERLDPTIRGMLAKSGVTDLAGLHSGWLLEKDSSGSGHSLYFYLGPDQEKIDFAEAMRDVLTDIKPLPPIDLAPLPADGEGYANIVTLADLHVGGHYGDPALEADFMWAIDDLVRRMPPAEKAYVVELGDLLDANDHKGVTPASGNPCDVIRHNYLGNVKVALRLMVYAIQRLQETHNEVEVHLIKGNHDHSGHIAVLVGLEALFAASNTVNIVVIEDEFRAITWGATGLFPHHGDTLKWPKLKDVWSDQFPDEWASSKAYRLIMTGHLHHEKSADLGGCVARQFGTLHRPNQWAMSKGLFSYGGLTAIRIHKDHGYDSEVAANIKPMLKGRVQ